jgi:LmbE family N-acetylglucosaminyl deacetylase
MNTNMRVLVIAPHPDDETLGCGGTLLKHRAAGDSVSWLIVTRGHEPQWSAEALANKEGEIERVAAAYEFEQVFRFDYPATLMDTLSQAEIIASVRQVIAEAQPHTVYLNHAGDVHSDHRIAFDSVVSAIKPFYTSRHGVMRLLSYETLSSTEAAPPDHARAFLPTVFCDITSFIEHKLEIMAFYHTEVQPYPMPRANESIRALARFRGAAIGVEYAEALMLIRDVV